MTRAIPQGGSVIKEIGGGSGPSDEPCAIAAACKPKPEKRKQRKRGGGRKPKARARASRRTEFAGRAALETAHKLGRGVPRRVLKVMSSAAEVAAEKDSATSPAMVKQAARRCPK